MKHTWRWPSWRVVSVGPPERGAVLKGEGEKFGDLVPAPGRGLGPRPVDDQRLDGPDDPGRASEPGPGQPRGDVPRSPLLPRRGEPHRVRGAKVAFLRGTV